MRGSVKRGAIKFGVSMLLLLTSAGVLAFGTTAHLIVGKVAEEHLCPAARGAIEPLPDGDDLGEAGLWADKIRGYSQWDYAKPWHYINVPDGVAIADVITADRRRPEGDVLFAIEEMERRLDNPTLNITEHAQALRFLVHFVADIHQPLHVGRRADLGGNKVKVSYMPAAGKRWKKTNLHRYWDSDALNTVVENPAAYAAQLMAIKSPDLADWEPGTPADWAAEALELRAEVYDFTPGGWGSPVRLDAAYQLRTLEILDQRLVLAGLRLAVTLNKHYCAAGEAEIAGPEGIK